MPPAEKTDSAWTGTSPGDGPDEDPDDMEWEESGEDEDAETAPVRVAGAGDRDAHDVDPLATAPRALERTKAGAFLTAQAGSYVNVMTIGWAQIGYMWSMPVLTVAVRSSRWTHQVLERARDFTVTVPWDDMSEALAFCGSQTGAKMNKIEACGLSLSHPFHVETPTVWCRGLHYECRIVCKTPLDPALMSRRLKSIYPSKDYHTFYHGEIVACYETD